MAHETHETHERVMSWSSWNRTAHEMLAALIVAIHSPLCSDSVLFRVFGVFRGPFVRCLRQRKHFHFCLPPDPRGVLGHSEFLFPLDQEVADFGFHRSQGSIGGGNAGAAHD